MDAPTLYILRGDDTTRFRDFIAGLKADLGDSEMADLNTTLLQGDSLNLETLLADTLTMPFLAPRRLVILEKARNFLIKFDNVTHEKLIGLFETLPETTALVFQVEDQQIRRRGERFWENSKSYDWLLEWVKENNGKALLVDCSLPDDEDMPAWIIRKAKSLGAGIRPDAAYLLTSYVGNDTLRAERELEKLIAYVGNNNVVAPADVTLLTAQNQEGNIFALTDALGDRNATKALEQFELLTQTSELIEISGMIYRQIRQLIQTREILDEGGKSKDVEEELHVPSFLATKLVSQARRFNMQQLFSIFERLLKIDENLKTGGMSGEVSFELLIAELTA